MQPDVLRAILDGLPMPVLAVDPNLRILAANPAAQILFGAVLEQRPFVTVIRHPLVNQAVEDAVTRQDSDAPEIGRGADGIRRLQAVLSARGRDVSCNVSVSSLPMGAGTGALVSIEDMTALHQAEQMRRDFVANVSHELRTPLTALMGFIETLRGPARNDADARARFLGIMEREAGRMNRLVADLLSLSRVETEERRRPAEIIDLMGLIRSVKATLLVQAQEAGVALELTGPDAPVRVPGDADQITQVLHNLIENAIKYGGSGGLVRLNVSHLTHEPQLRGPAWQIEVADRGEGIDAMHLPRLTERFYRVDTHRSREKGGTGLGLAIVKHIINRHRGRLRIESERGKGSRFIVILPEQPGY